MVSMVEHLVAVFTLRQLGLNTLREGWGGEWWCGGANTFFSERLHLEFRSGPYHLPCCNLHGVLVHLCTQQPCCVVMLLACFWSPVSQLTRLPRRVLKLLRQRKFDWYLWLFEPFLAQSM